MKDQLELLFQTAPVPRTSRPRALDLFCCAGGAGAGLYRAGFDVTGVDIDPGHGDAYMRCGAVEFVSRDVFDLDTPDGIRWIRSFDFVWASPPCLFACAYGRRGTGHVPAHEDFIGRTRAMLEKAGVPYVIENVDQPKARASLRDPVRLCGSSFGLDVIRHRLFEARGFDIPAPACDHGAIESMGYRYPCAGNRQRPDMPRITVNGRTKIIGRYTCEVGCGRNPLHVQWGAMGGGPRDPAPMEAPPMGAEYHPGSDCQWMDMKQVSKAIPPAYAAHIGREFLRAQSTPVTPMGGKT